MHEEAVTDTLWRVVFFELRWAEATVILCAQQYWLCDH